MQYTVNKTHIKSWHGNTYRIIGPLWGGFIDYRWISSQRKVTRSFDVFFDLNFNLTRDNAH